MRIDLLDPMPGICKFIPARLPEVESGFSVPGWQIRIVNKKKKRKAIMCVSPVGVFLMLKKKFIMTNIRLAEMPSNPTEVIQIINVLCRIGLEGKEITREQLVEMFKLSNME